MTNAQVQGDTSKKVLRKLSVALNADLEEVHDGAYLTFNNRKGSGNGKFLQIFPGLELWSFDLLLKESFQLTSINKWSDSLHLIFCLEGSVDHRFDSEKEWRTAFRFQNVIVGTKKPNASSLKFPANSRIKAVIFTITDELNLYRNADLRGYLPILLSETLKGFKKDDTYSYFGEVSAKSAKKVKRIIETKPIGLTKRLLIESSALGVLEHQFSDHSVNKIGRSKKKFSDYETIAIVQLSEHISNNLDADLSIPKLERLSGLNQKRIQSGFQYYFGESVNKFVNNVRIIKSKELLETTDMTITQIVNEIGLSSRSYFSKIFAKKYGVLPKEYQQVHHMSYPTFEFSYFSKISSQLSNKQFQDILETSKKNNNKKEITGCLIYHKRHFFQILEGQKSEVLATMDKIYEDDRHRDIEVVYQGFRSGRTFDEWDMAFIEEQPEFSSTFLNNVQTLKLDMLFLGDMKNATRTKIMWERARNLLLLKEADFD